MNSMIVRGCAAVIACVLADGCSRPEAPTQAAPAGAGPEEAAMVAAATTSFTGKEWTGCSVSSGAHDEHKPEVGTKFEIVETAQNADLYALKFTEPQKWAPGWKALTLSLPGSADAR